MVRARTPSWHFGGSAACDNCLRSCITMDQEGIVCFHCRQGVFIHRRFWHWSPCPTCHDNQTMCDTCHSKGTIPTPVEDQQVTDQLPAYWAQLGDRYTRRNEVIPLLIAERMRWAELDGCPVHRSSTHTGA